MVRIDQTFFFLHGSNYYRFYLNSNEIILSYI